MMARLVMLVFLSFTCITSGEVKITSGEVKNPGRMKIKRLLTPFFTQIGEEICLGGDLVKDLLGVKSRIKTNPGCGPPPTVCGANVTVDSTSNVANYKCQESMPGNFNSSGESRCNSRTRKWSPVNLQCYKTVVVRTRVNQSTAKSDCDKRGMTLLNLRNVQFTSRFSSSQPYSVGVWTGLEYNSTRAVFLWPDGRIFNRETDWDIGDPNSMNTDQCVILLRWNYRVDNRNCNDLYEYACSC